MIGEHEGYKIILDGYWNFADTIHNLAARRSINCVVVSPELRPCRKRRRPMRSVVLDTLGKLHAYHHGLSGWCRGCASLYRMSDAPRAPAARVVRNRHGDARRRTRSQLRRPRIGAGAVSTLWFARHRAPDQRPAAWRCDVVQRRRRRLSAMILATQPQPAQPFVWRAAARSASRS